MCEELSTLDVPSSVARIGAPVSAIRMGSVTSKTPPDPGICKGRLANTWICGHLRVGPACCPSRGLSAAQQPQEQLRGGGGIIAFVTYILKYICFSSKFNFREFHFFCQPISYSNFKLGCLVKDKCYGKQHHEKSHTAMYVIVFV